MYDLTFWNSAYPNNREAGQILKRYKRNHKTLDEAKEEANRVLAKLPNRGAHPAIIYDETGRQITSIR